MKKKIVLYLLLIILHYNSSVLPAETGASTTSSVLETLNPILDVAKAVTSSITGIDKNIKRAGQAFLALQAGRQITSDLKTAKQFGEEQLTNFFTRLAGNMEKLLLSFFVQTKEVIEQATTVLPYLSLALEESAKAYSKVPTTVKPGTESSTISKAVSLATTPIRGVAGMWERVVKGVWGERGGEYVVTPAKAAIKAASKVKEAGLTALRLTQQWVDPREYLIPLKPVLEEIKVVVPPLINNLQTLLRFSELLELSTPATEISEETTETPESSIWQTAQKTQEV